MTTVEAPSPLTAFELATAQDAVEGGIVFFTKLGCGDAEEDEMFEDLLDVREAFGRADFTSYELQTIKTALSVIARGLLAQESEVTTEEEAFNLLDDFGLIVATWNAFEQHQAYLDNRPPTNIYGEPVTPEMLTLGNTLMQIADVLEGLGVA